MDHGLVLVGEGRGAAGADGLDHLGLHAGLQRQRLVGVPLVLGAPGAGHAEDGQLGQARWQGGVVAAVLAQRLGGGGQLGALQPDRQRPAHAAARAAGNGVVHGALGRGHGVQRRGGDAWHAPVSGILGLLSWNPAIVRMAFGCVQYIFGNRLIPK
ncbi:hypothetical protein D3C86_1403190 [compost metagenome]